MNMRRYHAGYFDIGNAFIALDGDTGLASAINSISIICSIVFMVTLLIVTL